MMVSRKKLDGLGLSKYSDKNAAFHKDFDPIVEHLSTKYFLARRVCAVTVEKATLATGRG